MNSLRPLQGRQTPESAIGVWFETMWATTVGKVTETRGWLEEKWNAGRDDAGQDEPDKDMTNIMQNIVNIGEGIVERLLGVKVSKKAFDTFQMMYKDQMVGEWEEEAHTDLYHGVQIDMYGKFLDKLQERTGINDTLRKGFEMIEFMDKWDGSLQFFAAKDNVDKGTSTTGKYGMYLVIKRPHEVNP